MKIAICGSNDENRLHLIKSFISKWPMYATPAENIFDDIQWPSESTKDLEELKSKLNGVEKILFAKMLLLETQYEKYNDNRYIIYNGSSIDILINALALCEEGIVSEDFVERVIYHNKKLLRKLDVIYYQPNQEITEDSSEEDKKIENIYWNLYDNYQTDFNNSPFFDQKNCCSLLILETSSPLNEIQMLIDKDGNLGSTKLGGDDMIIDTERVKKVFGNNEKLLEAAKQSLSDKSFNSGSILI